MKKLPAKPAINLTAEKPPKLARPAVVSGGGGDLYRLPAGASFGQPVNIGRLNATPKRK